MKTRHIIRISVLGLAALAGLEYCSIPNASAEEPTSGSITVSTDQILRFTPAPGPIAFIYANQPKYFQFASGVKIDMSTGVVTVPEGLNLDQASRDFWRAVGAAYPGYLEEVVAPKLAAQWQGRYDALYAESVRLRAELETLKDQLSKR